MNLSYILNPTPIHGQLLYNINHFDNDLIILDDNNKNIKSIHYSKKEKILKSHSNQLKTNFLYNWSPSQVEILIKMVVECDFYSLDPMERRKQWEKIAKSLNRTVPAVRAKFSRLKLDSKLKEAAAL